MGHGGRVIGFVGKSKGIDDYGRTVSAMSDALRLSDLRLLLLYLVVLNNGTNY